MFVLGSQSARRKEILNFFKLSFIQDSSDVEEKNSFSKTQDPVEYACFLAEQKAKDLQNKHQLPILTADTLVYCEGQILEKPKDLHEAACMLNLLQGKAHRVITAMTLKTATQLWTQAQETIVYIRNLQQEQIKLYVQHIQPLDKSGSYTIQGNGNLIIEKIEGCFYNVCGLPIATCTSLLKHINVDLWQHL